MKIYNREPIRGCDSCGEETGNLSIVLFESVPAVFCLCKPCIDFTSKLLRLLEIDVEKA